VIRNDQGSTVAIRVVDGGGSVSAVEDLGEKAQDGIAREARRGGQLVINATWGRRREAGVIHESGRVQGGVGVRRDEGGSVGDVVFHWLPRTLELCL